MYWAHLRISLVNFVGDFFFFFLLDIAVLVDYFQVVRMFLVGWLIGFYGISTFVGDLTPNPFLCK